MIGDKVTMKPRSFCEENDEGGCLWMNCGHGDQLESVSLDYEFEVSDVSPRGHVELKGMLHWWNKHWFELSKQHKIESPWNE